MKKIKSFILSQLLGFLLLSCGAVVLVSLLSFNYSDSFFWLFQSEDQTSNVFGYFGSNFAGTSFWLFGNTNYILFLFFLFWGIRIILRKKISYYFLRFLSFVVSFILINLFCFYFLNTSTVVGEIQFNVLNNFFINNEVSLGYFKITIGLLVVITIPLLTLGLVIPFKYNLIAIITIFKYLYKSILFPLKLLKLNNVLVKNPTDKKNFLSTNSIKKSFKKKEPVFGNRENIKEKKDLGNIKNDNFARYTIPPVSLLKKSSSKNSLTKELDKRNSFYATKLEGVLKEFGVFGQIIGFKTGPIISLFEFQPTAGTKESKVIGLSSDIARSMSSVSCRISSQPGKNVIGIELPNEKKLSVFLGDLIDDELFKSNKSGLLLALGRNISGEKFYTDLEQMPHLLIAGTTGSGKSVGINSMIISLLYKFKPSECKFILIDPKMLELSVYENIPHLLSPVVTEPKKAVVALKWVVREMENRYRLMNLAGVKNIKSYNLKIEDFLEKGKKIFREVQTGIDPDSKMPVIEKKEVQLIKMPLIVVVIDEMADLMMVAGKDVEQSIQRLAQMARASGIHLIAATQRPSVDVITGTIKANFPSRISYRVASKFDSRTILNEMGAEQLLGSGDMLFLENGANLVRLHGGYISEKEIGEVVAHISSQSSFKTTYDITSEPTSSVQSFDFGEKKDSIDSLYTRAVELVNTHQKASTSFIQRHLQIGYNRAARIIEQMENEGLISEANHVGKRDVINKKKI